MDVWIHSDYHEFTAKYSTPDSILTVNNYKLYSIIYSSTLYAYRYPRLPYICPPSPAAFLRTSITSDRGIIALGCILFSGNLIPKTYSSPWTKPLRMIIRQKNSTYVSRFVGERSLTGKFFAFSAIKNLRRALNSESIRIVGSNAIDIKLRLKNKISFIFEFLYFYKFIFEKIL